MSCNSDKLGKNKLYHVRQDHEASTHADDDSNEPCDYVSPVYTQYLENKAMARHITAESMGVGVKTLEGHTASASGEETCT